MEDYKNKLSQMTKHSLLLHYGAIAQQTVVAEDSQTRLTAAEQFPYVLEELMGRMED